MKWSWVLLSTIAYQVLCSTLLVRLFDPMWLPNLSLLWVFYLADRSPSSPARQNEEFAYGLVLSIMLGYLTDLSVVAPRGLHMGVYSLTFLAMQLLSTRLSQAPWPQLVLTVGVLTFGVEALLWWVKGISIQFSFLRFHPWQFVGTAAANSLLALPAFPLMQRAIGDTTESLSRSL